MTNDYGFAVTQVGEKGSPERRRADEVSDYVLAPVLREHGLDLERADRDPAPGRITSALLKRLLEARVVIVDLTGRNANVYYELAIAHAFSRPVVALVDDPANIAFDVKDERTIPLGKYEGSLSVQQAEDAKRELRRTLEVVLADDYQPASLVSEVASARSLDQLAPGDPIASELASIRETLEELRPAVTRPRIAIPPSVQADRDQMRAIIERAVESKRLSQEDLAQADQSETSPGFDNWISHLAALVERSMPDPWAPPKPMAAPASGYDEPPF